MKDIKKLFLFNKKFALYSSKGMRYGQAFFNTLEEFFPEIANEIRNTNDDMYYMDDENAKIAMQKCYLKMVK